MPYIFNLAGQFRLVLLCPVLAALLIAGCGLGMDTQSRLERAQTALDEGEYRAAIIDSKNVLLDEPDNVMARVLLGRASLAVGDAASAEKEFRRSIELGADTGSVIVDLGRALVLLGDYEAVLQEVDVELPADQPNRLAAMRVRADALLGLRQTEEARDLYSEVLSSDENDIEAYLGVVRTYIADRNVEQAREVLRIALALDEAYIPSWLMSGSLAMRAGDLEVAARDFARAAVLSRQAEDDGREMSALTGQGEAELARQNFDAARIIVDRMKLLRAQDSRTLLLSARIATTDENWGTAQEALQEVLRRMPDNRQAQMLLGFVHKESGNLGQAEMYLSAVVTAVPNNAQARRMLAETRLMLDKAKEAREALDPLLTEPSPGAETLSMAAAASLSLDEFEDATAILERTVEAEPDNIPLKIQLAFAYYRANQPTKAQAVLEAIPTDSIAGNEFQRDSLLILSKMAQGDRDTALQEVRALRDSTPDLTAAHTLTGAVEISMGEYEAARQSFEDANRLSPDDIQPLRYLGQLDELEGDLESARGRYELLLELEPEDIRAMVSLARLASVSEDHSTARNWLERARKSDTNAIEPRRVLGALLLAYREFADADDVLSEALELSPNDAGLHSMIGFAKLGQRFYRDAEFNFARALDLDPDDSEHRYNLARAQSVLGNKSSAIATLQEIIGAEILHVASAGLLAALYLDVGNFDRAQEITSSLREQFPDAPVGYALQAEIEAKTGNFVEAANSYERALDIQVTSRSAIRAYQVRNQADLDDEIAPLLRYLELRPLDDNMRIYTAQAYQSRGDLKSANEHYERVLTNDPDSFIAANNLAWNLFELNDPRAEDIARLAYEIEPNSGAVADTLGWILVEKGALKEGIEVLHRAVELSEGRPDIRYHLAAALAADGQIGSAKNMLQELLESGEEFSGREAAEELLTTL